MEKEELAKIRNWTKLRLTGFIVDKRGLRAEEKILLDKAFKIIDHVINKWDKNSVALGLDVYRYIAIEKAEELLDPHKLYTKKDVQMYKKAGIKTRFKRIKIKR